MLILSFIGIGLIWIILGLCYFRKTYLNMESYLKDGNFRIWILAFLCGPIAFINMIIIGSQNTVSLLHLKFNLWLRRGRLILIDDEKEIKCSKCNGSGGEIHKYDNNTLYIIDCRKCNGEGKLDWIENAKGT